MLQLGNAFGSYVVLYDLIDPSPIFNKFNIGSCRAYDRAAVKFRGLEADINFIISDYEEDLKQVLITDVQDIMKTCML